MTTGTAMHERQPIRAILFDLDGTLNGIDMDQFLPRYFAALGEYLREWIEPQRLAREIWQATESLLQDRDVELTNAEKFRRRFLRDDPALRDLLYPLFDRFYEERFDALRSHAPIHPLAREAVETALDWVCGWWWPPTPSSRRPPSGGAWRGRSSPTCRFNS
ncbi:MAG: hypothetical protein GX496_04735 [Firmicutes bacterium]|nr:hypothetical protein [Bacillota bacterium]